MARTASDVQAEIEAKKAAGVHPATREMKELRAELAAVGGSGVAPEADVPAPAALPASDDVQFVNEALAQLLLKGRGAGKIEQAYSDIRAVLGVKHIIEDAAGLLASGRITLPHWDKLGRERDTGRLFKPGENQAIEDGLQQRAVPAPKVAASARPSITDPSGNPIAFQRSRTLNEPDGVASFVGADAGDAD